MHKGLVKHQWACPDSTLHEEEDLDLNFVNIKAGSVFRDGNLIHSVIDIPMIGDGRHKLERIVGSEVPTSETDLGEVENAIVAQAEKLDESLVTRLVEAGLDADAVTIANLVELYNARDIAATFKS